MIAISTGSWECGAPNRSDRPRLAMLRVAGKETGRANQGKRSEVPQIDIELINRPNERALGAGEAPNGPAAAAIGNAVFDALGVRVRELPLTPERIIAASNS